MNSFWLFLYSIKGRDLVFGDDGDDDDDDDDDDEFFCSMVNRRKALALFPAKTIVRDPHHGESPARNDQVLNMRRTWVQTYLNEVVQ